MPVISHYDIDSNVLIHQAVGHITMEMLIAQANTLQKSNEYPSNVNTIWDMRKTDYTNIDKAFLEELVALRKQMFSYREGAKLAYVASSDFEFGITRMYEMMSVDIKQKMHIFRTIDAAKAWLASDN